MVKERPRWLRGSITARRPFLYYAVTDQVPPGITWSFIVAASPNDDKKTFTQKAHRWAHMQARACARWGMRLMLPMNFKAAQVWVSRSLDGTAFSTAALTFSGEWRHWRRLHVTHEGDIVEDMPEDLREQLLIAWVAGHQPELL